MIRNLLKEMTQSELHTVMAGRFATISGGAMAVYFSFGVSANHLLCASVMSAPAALALAKLSYPEMETTTAALKDFHQIEKASTEHTLPEAVYNGASSSLQLVCGMAVNILVFLSLLAFINTSLTWCGDRVGIEGLTFELISSYVLYPVSYFMGVHDDDCYKLAELIGVKTFTNEFVAYVYLRDLINNRRSLENYTEFYNTTAWYWHGDHVILNVTGEVLKGGVMQAKSEVIATYALCGFSNVGAIGLVLGALGVLVPSRKSELSSMVVRAMMCGNVACFVTASAASLLLKPF